MAGGNVGQDIVQSGVLVKRGNFEVYASLECYVGNKGLGIHRVVARYRRVLKSVLDRSMAP